MINTRWVTCCHESGHGVVGVALGGRCNALLVREADGFAFVDQLSSDADAIMTAAGRAAEVLADRFTTPEGPRIPSPVPAGKADPLSVGVEYAATVSAEGVCRQYRSDSQALALWAIDGHLDEPEAWPERVARAHRAASRHVEHNATKILRVAEALYLRGYLSGEEIKTLLGEK